MLPVHFTNLLVFETEGCWLNGLELRSTYSRESADARGATELLLGCARLSTDQDDRDFTGALREFNLPTAIAPSEWPDRNTSALQLSMASDL